MDCVEAFGVIQAWDVEPANRGRIAEIENKAKRYPSDLTDEEWGFSTRKISGKSGYACAGSVRTPMLSSISGICRR
jgi:hypothetical protein